MKFLLYFVFALMSITPSAGQIVTLFQVTDTVLTHNEQNRIKELLKKRKTFFEDDSYTVTKTCSGEWGGTIKFIDKKTGTEYACASTCAVSVLSFDGAYIVTSSLAHLSGSTEILKITDPRSMEVFQMPPPRHMKGKRPVRYVGDNESRSKKGTDTLIDTVGVLTLGSFIFQHQLFHVVTDSKQTYIAKIENGKFKMIDLITPRRLRAIDRDPVAPADGHLIITTNEAFIEITDNQVKFWRAH
ncbi:MAG TPA: hypothetical protein VGD65_06270 [Chryseosolibacter sp.]